MGRSFERNPRSPPAAQVRARSVAFSERWIEIDLTAGPYPIPGRNEVRLFLRKRNPLIKQEIELTDVEMLVRYH